MTWPPQPHVSLPAGLSMNSARTLWLVALLPLICISRLAAQSPGTVRSFHVLKPVSQEPDQPPVAILTDDFRKRLSAPSPLAEEQPPTVIPPTQTEAFEIESETRSLGYEEPAAEPGVTAELSKQTLLTSYTDDFAVLGDSLDEAYDAADGKGPPIPPVEPGCLEKHPAPWIKLKSTSIAATTLPGSGDDFGITDFSVGMKIGSPRLPFLSMSPRYQMSFLHGPLTTDVPETLHRASLSIMGMMPFSPTWIGQVVINPGVASDFRNTSSDSMRVTGHALAIFMPSTETQWMFGVVYLDREDISLLPAVGVIYSPDSDLRFEVSFPRPRVLKRLSCEGENERWIYIAGEFGGGSWAVERANQTDDILTIRDYRLLGGMEFKRPENRELFWEAGLVFGRTIEYESGLGDLDQDAAFMFRGGVSF